MLQGIVFAVFSVCLENSNMFHILLGLIAKAHAEI